MSGRKTLTKDAAEHNVGPGIQLSKEQLAILADTGDIVDSSPCAYIMTNNAIFQSDGIDSFDSDYDEVSTAQATFMDCEQQAFIDDSNNEFTSKSNMISYEQYLKENKSQVVHSTPSPANQDSMIMSVIEQMSNQVAKCNAEYKENQIINESLTAELEIYKERIKTFKQRPNVDLSSREKLINSQMDDMIRDILALKQEIDSLKQTLSNQIKEKESLLQTFNVFKIESKEKESKYKDKEIDLEKKINELDNIVYKMGSVISRKHDVISVTDEEETLILEECSVDKKLFEIEKKELKLENERLLEHIICQDVVNIVMHADVKYVNVLHVQNTFLDDNIALDVLKMENDRFN
ncbi:hypothetical protein Tco_0952118 [Tanacetum coccineum]|uniref:Uncharacterized protein n=1 Tax=Tanacetum coccineum TaxID=301880 RepID=A0ABQ5DWR2_9ASTR